MACVFILDSAEAMIFILGLYLVSILSRVDGECYWGTTNSFMKPKEVYSCYDNDFNYGCYANPGWLGDYCWKQCGDNGEWCWMGDDQNDWVACADNEWWPIKQKPCKDFIMKQKNMNAENNYCNSRGCS